MIVTVPMAYNVAVSGNRIRFAALGDSVTVGYGDPMPGGGWRGWASLLADALGGPDRVEYHNLAASGARTGDVAGEQLAAALAIRPHLASVVVGVNDTLRDSFDPRTVGLALAGTVAALRAGGAIVLTARLPDPGRMFRPPAALARPLARRMRAVNAIADAVADRFGTCHVDLADDPSTYDSELWSVDRLHPSERGHRWLARRFADSLRAAGVAVPYRPAAEPTNPPPTATSRLWWLATQGTGWLLRRSTNLVPSLAALVLAEWWYGVRGTASRIDGHLAHDVTEALAHIERIVAGHTTVQIP